MGWVDANCWLILPLFLSFLSFSFFSFLEYPVKWTENLPTTPKLSLSIRTASNLEAQLFVGFLYDKASTRMAISVSSRHNARETILDFTSVVLGSCWRCSGKSSQESRTVWHPLPRNQTRAFHEWVPRLKTDHAHIHKEAPYSNVHFRWEGRHYLNGLGFNIIPLPILWRNIYTLCLNRHNVVWMTVQHWVILSQIL